MSHVIDGTLVEKRRLWLEALTGEDRHSIHNQIAVMTWDAAAFRIINEARRLAGRDSEGEVQLNELVHGLLNRGFFSSLFMAIRRLTDTYPLEGNRPVFSLTGLIKDMSEHTHLMTRSAMLSAEGLVYDYEPFQKEDLAFATEQFAAGIPALHGRNTRNWSWSEHRHEVIDRLTRTERGHRQRTDTIPKERFAYLAKLVKDSSTVVTNHVNKFVAHTATPSDRATVALAAITLAELWKAHEILCRVACVLATEFLGDSFSSRLATPLFDVFAHIGKPLVAEPAHVNALRQLWEDFARETEKWNWCESSESEKGMFENEYDEFPT